MVCFFRHYPCGSHIFYQIKTVKFFQFCLICFYDVWSIHVFILSLTDAAVSASVFMSFTNVCRLPFDGVLWWVSTVGGGEYRSPPRCPSWSSPVPPPSGPGPGSWSWTSSQEVQHLVLPQVSQSSLMRS